MSQRDREPATDSDPHDLLFGGAGPDDHALLADGSDGHYDRYEQAGQDLTGVERNGRHANGHDISDGAAEQSGQSRSEMRSRTRQRHRRRFVFALAVLLVIVVGVSAWFIGMPIYRYFNPSDYSGSGTGSVIVTVHENADASQIGATLERDGVVASSRAFTDAAENNSKSANIQPGSYRLHHHMSAKSAITLLLRPTSRVNSDVVVTEGATILDVEKRLTAPRCTVASKKGTICGLGLPEARVKRALEDVAALGLPTDFTVDGKRPQSAEGFLYPATYPFDDTTSPAGALTEMVGEFTDQARSTSFTAQAKKLGITPYQELIIASIAQSEAKYPSDMAKVARVILNRLAHHQNLQIDATSAYAAKLKGLDPTKTIYAQAKGPYNTYDHAGLPPTPISNPGAEAMLAAARPSPGNWLYYVNKDAAGHLFFTNNAKAFSRAQHTCFVHHWGCADS